MGKIYYMMGKSSSGKDTLYKEVLKALPKLKTLVLYTTRPIREGEQEGIEYHFVTDEELERFEKAGKIIEERTYDTVYGAWKYATIEDGQINLAAYDYLVIGTLESYAGMKKCYGAENLEEAGIVRRYYNDDKVQCLEKIIGEIQNGKF